MIFSILIGGFGRNNIMRVPGKGKQRVRLLKQGSCIIEDTSKHIRYDIENISGILVSGASIISPCGKSKQG